MTDLKILIVEDEAIVAEDIASRLEKMGYVVLDIVASGEEAIEVATITAPDLVLMDIMLQGELDGVQAAEQIWLQLNTPVVYLTAYADDNTLKRAKITKPFGYILKPFKEQELRVTIEIALSRHQAEAEVKKALASAEARQREAEENSHLKTQYISMAAHDFRTPLTTIKSSALLLEHYSSKWSEEKKQHHLQRIAAASDSINELLEDVLTLGRAESGQLTFNPTPVNLVSFCEEITESMQVGAGDCYTLTFKSTGDSITACLDEKLIWHLLNNLLSNAIKYSPEGGHVSLTLSCENGQISFQVKDRGIGISAEDQKMLFAPFHRASNVGKIPGTGLGLAIVKRSVDLHNGQIKVNSELGRGTTFTVTLPMTPPQKFDECHG